jgi:ketosteroid isomerase-like protein
VRRSGQKVDYDWIHVFTVKDGKVVAWRVWLDGAVLAAAYHAQPVAAA